MKKRHIASQTRVWMRMIPRVVAGFFCIAVVIIAVVIVRSYGDTAPYRQGIAIIGNSVRIVSFTPDRNSVSVLEIPSDTVIPSVMGYGMYTVESLLSLDTIDKHNGNLLTKSISDAVGFPVIWYIRDTDSDSWREAIDSLRRIFSFKSAVQRIAGGEQQTVPVQVWLAMVKAVGQVSPDSVLTIDGSAAITRTQMPDGSFRPVLDENKLDYILEHAFIDSTIRTESLTVAVYNTTDVPTVGLRTSRIMSGLGIQLVFVGNAPNQRTDCVLSGSDAVLKSKTAGFIRSYFNCTDATLEESSTGKETGADLIVELGTSFASLYRK